MSIVSQNNTNGLAADFEARLPKYLQDALHPQSTAA